MIDSRTDRYSDDSPASIPQKWVRPGPKRFRSVSRMGSLEFADVDVEAAVVVLGEDTFALEFLGAVPGDDQAF